MQVPLDSTIKDISKLPYTISYVIRKREQIDSFRELPKEKRPTERMIWEGTSEEIEEWLDKVFDKKSKKKQPYYDGILLDIDESNVEG